MKTFAAESCAYTSVTGNVNKNQINKANSLLQNNPENWEGVMTASFRKGSGLIGKYFTNKIRSNI